MIQLTTQETDVLILGATPGGIGAAIAAARRGRSVIVVERSDHIGGLMTNGLGRTDIMALEASGAVFREFAARVVRYYAEQYGEHSRQVRECGNGLLFEPHVAEHVLQDMLRAERRIECRIGCELDEALLEGSALRAVRIRSLADSAVLDVKAHCFIDATYEGDLAAMAGVPYSVGRESRAEWNEEYAGKLYIEWFKKLVLPGSTGEGDESVQAYNFRLCLTRNAANRVPVAKPDAYRRDDYISLLDDVAAGRIRSLNDVMNIKALPNDKVDANNHHCCLCSTDWPEENAEYPTGDWPTRERIVARHRDYIQGLLWFAQHDEELPQAFRDDALEWGYAADEFRDNGHFPRQIYVREARRIHGEYTFTENDARLAPGLGRSPIHYDSIAVGEYPIDSHAAHKRDQAGSDITLEGFLSLGWLTRIYQIPYGAIVPLAVDNLLVPVAVSATHMGFGTIRMEPCWMQVGFAAGVAADLSVRMGIAVRELSVDLLQCELLAEGQRITYLSGLEWEHECREALEYFGTKGWFEEYDAQAEEALAVREASRWIGLARSLPGGRSLPALPASARLLPVGEDMGPRSPRQEPAPPLYWQDNPLLPREMGLAWLSAAARALHVEAESTLSAQDGVDFIRRGEFCLWLYRLLGQKRSSRQRP